MKHRVHSWKFAVPVTAAMVILSIGMGAGLSLSSLRNDALDIYTEGESGWGGIQTDYDTILDSGENLLTVAERYLDANDTRIRSVELGLEAMRDAQSPSEQCTAAQTTRTAVDNLDEQLLTMTLSETDQQFQNELIVDIEAGYRRISQSTYNETAEAFNRKLQQFPAGIFADMMGIEPLELYA